MVIDVDDPVVEVVPLPLGDLLDDPECRPGRPRALATGFALFDEVTDGGVQPGDLAVVGGRPGVGKTIVTLQWARWMAMNGRRAVYVSYEHDERQMLWRLLMCETRELMAAAERPDEVDEVRRVVRDIAFGVDVGGRAYIFDETLVHRAVARVRSYADRLMFVRASGSHTKVRALAHLLRREVDACDCLFVDYLQKVPNGADVLPGSDHVARVAGGLKDLALEHGIGVVAISSADHSGLVSPRIRLHNLRGSEALAYEADVVVILNDKTLAVSKAHRAYDPVRARTFRDRVVFSLEKNRRGKAPIDLEFTKEFDYFRFDPEGGFVADRLVDDLLHEE